MRRGHIHWKISPDGKTISTRADMIIGEAVGKDRNHDIRAECPRTCTGLPATRFSLQPRRQRIDACLDNDDVDLDDQRAGRIAARICGVRQGKAAVLDLIGRQRPALLPVSGLHRLSSMLDRRRPRAMLRACRRVRRAGRSRHQLPRARSSCALRDDKLVEFRAVIDSFDAAEQVLGHPIDYARGRCKHWNLSTTT